MTIADARQKCKNFLASRLPRGGALPRDILVIGVLVLTSLLSFGLGFMAGKDSREAGSVRIEASPLSATAAEAAPNTQGGQFVASKNGTKYYLPSCAGASRISDANKVWFDSAPAAKEAGYSPASNCKGL